MKLLKKYVDGMKAEDIAYLQLLMEKDRLKQHWIYNKKELEPYWHMHAFA